MIKHRLLLLILTISLQSHATLITGELDTIRESAGTPFIWGNGINDLFQEWSVASANSSGWFYSSEFPWSNADIFVYSGLNDPLSISDASQFNYQTSGALLANEGDTVFFRGVNGFYGAWYIEDIFSGVNFYSALSGQWYFQDDGSANFSSIAVPTPGVFLLFLLAMSVICRRSLQLNSYQ